MEIKLLEVRDRATFIPIYAIKPEGDNEAQRYLLARSGFDGGGQVIISFLAGERPSSADPYSWGGRTLPVAHQYVIDHFDELQDGDVIDVEFILGETAERKLSERLMVSW